MCKILISSDHERKSLASYKLSMSIHGGAVIVLGQCYDRFADDTGDNPPVRSHGTEPCADSDVDGHLLEHRWSFDSRW